MIYKNRTLLSADELSDLSALESQIWLQTGNWKFLIREAIQSPSGTSPAEIMVLLPLELKELYEQAKHVSDKQAFAYGSDPGVWIGESMRELLNSLFANGSSQLLNEFLEAFAKETEWVVWIHLSCCQNCRRIIPGEIVVSLIGDSKHLPEVEGLWF